jgi:hypothetical protein
VRRAVAANRRDAQAGIIQQGPKPGPATCNGNPELPHGCMDWVGPLLSCMWVVGVSCTAGMGVRWRRRTVPQLLCTVTLGLARAAKGQSPLIPIP